MNFEPNLGVLLGVASERYSRGLFGVERARVISIRVATLIDFRRDFDQGGDPSRF